MTKIERWIIDKVLDATSIVDVIGEFVELRKAGVNYTGCCSSHEDHHDGNFIVRPEGAKTGGGTYRCFVCDAKGGVVQFLMQHEKMTFPDANILHGQTDNEIEILSTYCDNERLETKENRRIGF